MKKVFVAILAFAVWIIANLGAGWSIGRFNFDMTTSKQYTLNNASVTVAKSVKNPLKIKLFVSSNLSAYDMDAYNYSNYVATILNQYQKQNPDNISFEIVKVKAYSAEAKMAEKSGVKAIPYNDEYVYFGLEISGGDKVRHISELIVGRRPYFENNINRIIINIISDVKDTIGIVSTDIPIFSGENKDKIWSLPEELAFDYKLVNISDRVAYIPAEVKVLILLNPTNYPPLFVYAVDQYLMRGGKLIVFADPYSEIAHYYKGYPPVSQTNIQPLLSAWGLEYDNNQVVGSLGKSLRVAGGIDYPLWFFTQTDKYKKLHFRSPGHINIKPKDYLSYEVLAVSPKDGGIINTNLLRYSSKKKVAENFEIKNKTYNLAVKAKGTFVSNYRQGFFDGTAHQNDIPPYEAVSDETSTVVVIADSDFMSNDTWVLSANKNNPVYSAEPYADNAEFILSIINELLDFTTSDIKNSSPKYIDMLDITTQISTPIIKDYEQKRIELTEKYNKAQKQLNNAEISMITTKGGERIKYRQQVNRLKEEVQTYVSELDKINSQIGYQTEKSVTKLMLYNLAVYPTLLLFAVVLICLYVRNRNLKRIK